MDLRKLVKAEADFLREECNFSDEELEVFNLRIRGKRVTEISMKRNMSESTVKRRLCGIRHKVERVNQM